MSIASFGGADAIDVGKSLESALKALQQLVEALAEDEKQLDYVLNGNLDVKNIRANSVNADRIQANTITADRMNVQQLSAIAADLGTITAGQIFGAYIATANGTYPRTEISTTGNQFAAYQNADAFVKMGPAAAQSSPGFNFKNGVGHDGQLNMLSTDFYMLTPNGSANIQISSGIDLYLNANNGIRLNCSVLRINGIAGYTGSFLAGTQTVTVNNGIITNVI